MTTSTLVEQLRLCHPSVCTMDQSRGSNAWRRGRHLDTVLIVGTQKKDKSHPPSPAVARYFPSGLYLQRVIWSRCPCSFFSGTILVLSSTTPTREEGRGARGRGGREWRQVSNTIEGWIAEQSQDCRVVR